MSPAAKPVDVQAVAHAIHDAMCRARKIINPGLAVLTWDDLPEESRDVMTAGAAVAVDLILATPAPEPDAAADVHVDWHMTPAEWAQLSGVLASHALVPYIAQLIADGTLPADVTLCTRPATIEDAQPAPGPDAAMAETREVRAVAAEVLDMAEGQIEGRTHIRLAEIAEWRKRAGIGADR